VLGICMYVPIYWIGQPYYEPVIGFSILVLVLLVRPPVCSVRAWGGLHER